MKTLTAKTLAKEILTIAAQWGWIRAGGTFQARLSTGEVATITIPAPECAPRFTAATRYHAPRQLPTAGQLTAINEIAAATFAITG